MTISCRFATAIACLGIWGLAGAAPAETAVSASAEGSLATVSPHPVVTQLVTTGLELADGVYVKLPPPLVGPEMSAAQQQAALETLPGRLREYTRKSVTAKDYTRVKTGEKIPGQGTVRRMEQYFIVHGKLSLIRDKELMNGFMADEKKRDESEQKKEKPKPFKQYMERIDPQADEETSYSDGLNESSLFKMRYPLLEKVVMSGLLQTQSYADAGVLIESGLSSPDLLSDSREPTVWRKIPAGAKGDADLGPPQPFRGIAGYMQVTDLKCLPGAVMVETHGVLIEPKGWFGGRNQLASKLPLLAKQNIKVFRRKVERLNEAAAGQAD